MSDFKVIYEDEEYAPDDLLKKAWHWHRVSGAEFEAILDAAKSLQAERDEALDALEALATMPEHRARSIVENRVRPILRKHGRLHG